MPSDVLSGKVTWSKRLWVAFVGILVFWSLNSYMYFGKLIAEGKQFAYKDEQGVLHICDFINSYGAGMLARQCIEKPVRIYDREVQGELQRQIVAPVKPDKTFYFQYAPQMFLFCMPLAFMGLTAAWYAWCITMGVVSLVMLRVAILPRFDNWFAKLTVVAFFFGSFPTWLSARLGQPTLLLFPVYLGFWHLLKQKRFVLAGVVASLVIAKLQYLPMVAAVGTAIGGIRFLAGFAGSSVCILGLCTLVVGWSNVMDFPNAISKYEVSEQVMGVSPEKMQNLRGLLFLWFGSDSGVVHYVVIAAAIVGVIAMFVVWMRASTASPQRFDVLAAITTLVMLVTSPHCHTQDYMLALLPCAWLYSVSQKNTELSKVLKRFLNTLIISYPIAGWVFFMLMVVFVVLLRVQPFAVWAIAFAATSVVVFNKIEKDVNPPLPE